MLAIAEGQLFADDIMGWIGSNVDQSVPGSQSLYRALRRHCDDGLVQFELVKSPNGPDKKSFRLTEMGENLLHELIDKNVSNFFIPAITKRIGTQQ